MDTKYDRITVRLDAYAGKVLEELVERHKCTVTDIVNAALITAKDAQFTSLITEKTLLETVTIKLNEMGQTLESWCTQNGIDRRSLADLCRRVEKGCDIYGNGSTGNRWRDKEDDRVYRTHTAYITECVERDTGINFREL